MEDNNRIWTLEMDSDPLFAYNINIPLSKSDYQSKILTFDHSFLIHGFELGIYLFSELENTSIYETEISKYINEREEEFISIESEFSYLQLLDLWQWKSFRDKIPQSTILLEHTKVSDLEENLKINSSSYRQMSQLISIDKYCEDQLRELNTRNDWESNCFLSISSHSNIWLDIIDLSEVQQSTQTEKINNYEIAYRLTPKFNSFLKRMKTTVTELGGTVELDEHYSKYVTEDGILLDGKIIYQEDIDEGRVSLPNE